MPPAVPVRSLPLAGSSPTPARERAFDATFLLQPGCVFDSAHLTPLLGAVRARVTGDRSGFTRFAEALRTAVASDPFDAYIHATALAVTVGRQLRDFLSVGDMVREAIGLSELADQGLPVRVLALALIPMSSLILGHDADPAEFLGDNPVNWARAALVNQVVAAGLIMLAADVHGIRPAEEMSRVQAEVISMTA